MAVPCLTYKTWTMILTGTYAGNRSFIIPGGPIGQRYVDLLVEKVAHLAGGHFLSERVLIFSSVILQCDCMVRKGADIRHLLERRIELWRQGNFDLLVQEAEHCDLALRRTHHSAVDEESIIRVFTRLMLCGKVKSAVRWATKRAKGIVLAPSDVVFGSTTVMDALREKHPPPAHLIPVHYFNLIQFEDVKITGDHILHAARRIQGGAGPGGCDAGHWRDAFLRYGAHSACLRDAVATLVQRLANSITQWSDVCALISNHLIALECGPLALELGTE